MSDEWTHDAGHQARETERIYRERRVASRQEVERLAATARAARAERQAQQRGT